jgi:hypothetical protein
MDVRQRGAPGVTVGFRPRALDHTNRLAILRSVDELSDEAAVSRGAAHSHVALDRENEEVRPSPPSNAWAGPASRRRARLCSVGVQG